MVLQYSNPYELSNLPGDLTCGAPPLSASSSVLVNILPFGPPSLQASSPSGQVGQIVTLTCSQSGQSASVTSSTTVTVNGASTVTVSGSTGSGGGSGGGGALEWLELAFFGALVARRARQTSRSARGPTGR
jgi:hypothetical protein